MKINEYTPDIDIFKNIGGGDNNQVSDNDSSTSDFGSLLKSKLDEVNNDQVKSDASTKEFIEGDNTDIHNVMLDSEQAKLSLELAVQVRNKLVDAYQELNRTQL